jgi:hypothetical protein
MIDDTITTTKGSPAITSGEWHVVHSHFTDTADSRPFARTIVSEHPDRALCKRAARRLRARLAETDGERPAAQRDEVFVRPPNYKSLKTARSRRPASR